MNPSATILLSTYNGEKYLAEQIESLLNQKNVNIQIIARDDGSKDETLSILKHYAASNIGFSVYSGGNVGPAKSFLDLLLKANESDYYAFCDQDDVWDDDKLACAIDHLKVVNISEPSCYFSNLRIVDHQLTFYRLSHSAPLTQKSKYSALTEDMATGCTLVFNAAAKKLVQTRIPQICSMHDSWIYLVCKFFGTVVYDTSAHISYRQHGSNVVGTYLEKKSSSIYISRAKRLFNRNLQPRYTNAINFLRYYGDLMNEEDLTNVAKIANYKNSIKDRLSLLLDKNIYASSLSRDIRYRLLIIFGIV